MASDIVELARCAAREIGSITGTVLVLGGEAFAAALRQAAPALRLLLAGEEPAAAVRAQADALPFAARSLAAIVAHEVLSRFPAAEPAISAWCEALAPSGRLVVIERLIRSSRSAVFGARTRIQSATLRVLRRLVSAPRFQHPPEQLAACMLNAGFLEIGQRWPPARVRTVVTSGSRLAL